MWWHDETCVSDKNCSCSHPSDVGIAENQEFAEKLKINKFFNGQFKNKSEFSAKNEGTENSKCLGTDS